MTRRASPTSDLQAMDRGTLFTIAEVGRVLRVSTRTLQAWRATGKLRVVAFSSRCVRVEPAEVERLIREARS